MDTKLTGKTRIESDLIGAREIPAEALYGVQTLRGIENFSISKFRLSEYPLFIKGLAITKMAAAMANFELGLLTVEQKDAIIAACGEILDGKHHDQFPVDMIQGGAGTTTNMNANEVIANNAARKEKRLWTENPEGEKLHFRQFMNGFEEAEYVIGDIAKKKRN